MRRNRIPSLAAAASVLAIGAVAAFGSGPASAGFQQPLIACSYDPATKLVTISYGDATAPDPGSALPAVVIERNGKEIAFSEVFGGEIDPRACAGGTPTVDNTDRINLGLATPAVDSTLTFIDFGKGPIGPGATPEPGGSEIEMDADLGAGAAFDFTNTKKADSMTFGVAGGDTKVNFNPAEKSPDADLILRSEPEELFINGSPGDDRMIAAGGAGTGEPLTAHIGLIGGAGDDRLAGGAGDDYFQGDHGNDLLRGLGGDDRIDIYGGEGSDRLLCGGGDDQAGVDKSDTARGCERTTKPH